MTKPVLRLNRVFEQKGKTKVEVFLEFDELAPTIGLRYELLSPDGTPPAATLGTQGSGEATWGNVRTLGHGTYGVVVRAKELALDISRAVKLLYRASTVSEHSKAASEEHLKTGHFG
ncbi:MAG: hypothetical protein KJ067_25485 [Vicinamibacteria bacterium]|nr:hypothetical protein [Vicinamibacteria bacterium]